ncbi:PP2C family serine/threonine-protein phosphatase [Heyndrickxia oleronia]|uniref:PP2C family serine/threonine-protein phosphatase n=1 Tax=Heyndrickxia oleronia TaxID=38875 RepID=UPI001B2A83C3|nr:PP2C family serine/threonine-protein phosphatase [Heyndrickxia oleronia]GIN39876.1 hypothetical protein J19TS1_28250 [Heyndrickxia oleronia]
MIIIELLNEGKLGKADLCEDMYVINDYFIAVIDGATNVSGRKINGKTPGRLAAELIKETIQNLPKDMLMSNMIEEINKNMQSAYKDFGIYEEIKENAWLAPTASLIVYSKHYHEIWQIGDCQCMIDGTLFTNEKKIDEITANARSMYLEAEIEKGKTIEELLENDTGWNFIQELIQMQYNLQNVSDNQYGFEIINGFPVNLSTVKTIKVPNDAKQIVMASDGYPFLKDTLKESEEILADIMEKDPLCFRIYKSSKGLNKGNHSFDDRTYIKFEV